MARAFLQYDVFTGEPLLGNQLAVFTDGRGLDTSMMQRIAREMNFAESTFILPVEWAGTDIRMRIFTPAVEMPMAGHPTIGSTFALAHAGVITPGTQRFIFHLNAGPTPVGLEWDGDRLAFAWMSQPNPVFGRVVDDRAAVASLIGLAADDLLPGVPVQEVSCGVPFLYVPVRDAGTVDRAVPDTAAFKRLAQTGIDLPVFLFALDERSAAGSADSASADASAIVYSRMFGPVLGIVEDPATGIASGPLGCYLVRHGLVPAAGTPREGGPAATHSMVSHQGVAMGRASRIHISVGETGGVIDDVKVGGEAVLVAHGELLV
jgi:trans-2,3-dihydro-3-hydroxyanthranilate isomerase